MFIESPYETSYMMAIVMLAISFTTCLIFSKNVTWPWPWPLDKNRQKRSHIHEKRKRITYHTWNLYELDLYNGLGSNVNRLIERPCAKSYLMEIVLVALSVTILELFTVEMCMTLTFRKSQGQVYICQSKVICDCLCVGNSHVCPIYAR